MKKNKRTLKLKNLLFILVIITLIIILTISIFNIVKWKVDSNKTNEEINNIQKNINVEEVEDTGNTEIITYNRRIVSKHFLFIILV